MYIVGRSQAILVSNMTDAPKEMGLACNTFVAKLFDNAGQTIFYDFSRTKVEVKLIMIWKQNMTLLNPKMYPHTKFGIPTSKNIEDMFLELKPEVKVILT